MKPFSLFRRRYELFDRRAQRSLTSEQGGTVVKGTTSAALVAFGAALGMARH